MQSLSGLPGTDTRFVWNRLEEVQRAERTVIYEQVHKSCRVVFFFLGSTSVCV